MGDFGKYLRALRENERLSLREVEELTEVSNAYLSQLETGKRKNPPSPVILRKLAHVYGVSLKTLMVRAGYLEPPGAKERERERIDQVFTTVLADRKFHWGTRLKGTQISLEMKKVIIEMYEKLTKRRVL